MIFGQNILNYWDDIIKDLDTMVSIPSVSGAANGNHPFGDEPARAIDAAIAMADTYGLKSKNVDYYACHIELGEGEQNAVVMAHLDVVPAGEGWNSDPFTMKIDGNIAYGRGVSDNKGPAIIALHCLRALKDAGIVGKRKLRVVLGSSEEVGMDDMRYYYSKEQIPTFGFTPDSSYGICYAEKGILNFSVEHENDSSIVKSFVSGTVTNAVPYKAECEITCSDEEFQVLSEAAYKLENEYVVTKTDDGAYILSKGLAAHASRPTNGINAASHLIELLYSVFGDKIGTVLTCAYKKIGLCSDGSKMGIECEDEETGALTFNLGLVNVCAEKASYSIDIRYPATLDGEIIIEKIKSAIAESGATYCNDHCQPPLYLPKDGEFIRLLASSYKSVMNEDCNIFTMGGGTYARTMSGKGVAFGASWPGTSKNVHNCNEEVDLESLKLHAQICLEAMYNMFTTDWND